MFSFSFFWENVIPFSMRGLPHMSFNFPVELSHLILCDCHNAFSLTINFLIVPFSFIHYPYFVWSATPFCLFSEWNCPTLLCVNITQIPCLYSPLSLCDCHTCPSPFSLCECHTNILVFPILLSGHSTLFPFRSWLTHSRSTLCGLPHLTSQMKNSLVLPLFSVLII